MSSMNSAGGDADVGSEGTSVARLVDWVEGRLSNEEAAEVEASLAEGGEDARSTLLCVQQFLAAAHEVQHVGPPPELRQVLLEIFGASRSPAAGSRLIHRIAAVLTSDSWGGMAPVGVRGETAARERHLAYSTEATDLVLDISPAPRGRFRIDGQVLPNTGLPDTGSDDLFYVQVLADDVEAAITLCDEIGEFSFENLDPGTYRLVVGTDQGEIIVEPVELAS